MPEINPDYYNRCRNVFVQCREFESDKVLHAFFQLYLFPLHIGLSEANSIQERVELCLAFVSRKRFNNGEPALFVLLNRLQERYSDSDALRIELNALFTELSNSSQKTLNPMANQPMQRHRLFDLLLRLNFRPQVQMVKHIIENHNVGAFIINGPPDYGQRILIRRLSHLQPQWDSGRQIIVDAGANGTGKSSRSLWREIAKRVDLPITADPQLLADRVCQWLKTQDVIFVIHSIDDIPIVILRSWIEEFWKPLVMAVRKRDTDSQSFHLVLFMVDYSGKACDEGLEMLSDPELVGKTYLPLRLPPTAVFPENELDIWLDTASELLPSRLTVHEILKKTENGVPDLVYEYICRHCGINWEGDLNP